jgi:hypothetical protein
MIEPAYDSDYARMQRFLRDAPRRDADGFREVNATVVPHPTALIVMLHEGGRHEAYATSIMQIVQALAESDEDDDGPACMFCDTQFWRDEWPCGFVVMDTACSNGGLISGICAGCVAGSAASKSLMQRVCEAVADVGASTGEDLEVQFNMVEQAAGHG